MKTSTRSGTVQCHAINDQGFDIKVIQVNENIYFILFF